MTTESAALIFGEVLYDEFPDGNRVLGGAPFNVAWHLQAFGAQPTLVSRVGKDANGASILARMRDWGMDTRCVQEDEQHPTGTVQVRFQGNEPVFDIVDLVAYDFIQPPATIAPLPQAKIFYHGSLALRNQTSRDTCFGWRARVTAPRFIDINLRNPWWNLETIPAILDQAGWVKLNEDELQRLQPAGGSLEDQARAFMHAHRIGSLVLTRGARGAWLLGPNAARYEILPEFSTHVVDTVGAGDAFASIMLLGIIRGWETALTLQRAQSFASAIVGIRGATTTDAEFYQPFQSAWEHA